jgi:hypothetical protein
MMAAGRAEPTRNHGPVRTPIRLSAAVMTHTARLRYAEELRARHPELDLQIVVDPKPGGEGGSLRTARIAWDTVAADATHHLVVQDDSTLSGSFRQHLEQTIAAKPNYALSLYTEWGSQTSYAARLAALVGSAWTETIDHYVPTQALVLPAEAARAFPRFSAYAGPFDDVAMLEFLSSRGMTALLAVPNLVDDAGLDSTISHGFLGPRSSVCFPPDNPDDVDWYSEPLVPTTVPAFGFLTGQPYSVVRSDQPGRTWHRGLHPVACRLGIPYPAVLGLGRATIRRCPGVMKRCGQRMLFGLWLIAYGLGIVAGDLLRSREVTVEQALARPIARRALETMPHGALRVLVDEHRLTESLDDLCQIVETGLYQGFETRSAVPPKEKL